MPPVETPAAPTAAGTQEPAAPPAVQAQAQPPATDPPDASAARIEALEKRLNDLASKNGRLEAQVKKLPNADAFVEAFDTSEQMKVDLLAKGVTQEALDELDDKPKALRAMHKSFMGQQPATDIAAMQAELAALKAPKAPAGSTTQRITSGGGNPLPKDPSWDDAQKIKKPTDLSDAAYFKLVGQK